MTPAEFAAAVLDLHERLSPERQRESGQSLALRALVALENHADRPDQLAGEIAKLVSRYNIAPPVPGRTVTADGSPVTPLTGLPPIAPDAVVHATSGVEPPADSAPTAPAGGSSSLMQSQHRTCTPYPGEARLDSGAIATSSPTSSPDVGDRGPRGHSASPGSATGTGAISP